MDGMQDGPNSYISQETQDEFTLYEITTKINK